VHALSTDRYLRLVSDESGIAMNFVSRVNPPNDRKEPAYWFLYQGEKLLVWPNGDTASVPLLEDIAELEVAPVRHEYLGYIEDERGQQTDCYSGEIGPDAPLPHGMTADGLRQLFPLLGETMSALAGRAIQVVGWDRSHLFCGHCGTPTEILEHERARRCPQCGLTSYPRISPAIIIAVVRPTPDGHQLLLARNHRFPPGRYSVLAGYVEPGESLEECAEREVFEEVGIRIKNIRYFGSQPWPFPNSLMIGFTAEHESGEIALEESELAEAQWFQADALPGLPPSFTIARRLINWFVEANGNSVD
jgi:NAD+ diphosphatase